MIKIWLLGQRQSNDQYMSPYKGPKTIISIKPTDAPNPLTETTGQNEVNDLILQLGKIRLGLNEVDRIKRELEASQEEVLDKLASCSQNARICPVCNRSLFGNYCAICQQIR